MNIFSKGIIYVILFCNILSVSAHPLDISVSTAGIKGNHINFTTYFHSFEIEYLLKGNNIHPDGIDDYFIHGNIIKDYVESHVFFSNNNHACTLKNIELIQDEAYIILSEGLGVSYSFLCEDDIKKFYLQFKYFLEFPLQTNRVTLYDLNNGAQNIQPIIYKVLNPKISSLQLNVENLGTIESIDTDRDGLSDEEEKVYQTNPNLLDTDGDFYTDKEEIDYGWDPLNKDLGPSQAYREKLDIEISEQKIDELQKIRSDIKKQNLGDYGYGNNILKSVMKYLNDFFTKQEGNLLYIFLIVFGLGIVHAVGPGHSKSLLISYTLEKENGYKKGFIFASIFSIVHILDIIILFVITKVLISFFDPSKYTYYIQGASGIILFILGLYLLYSALRKKTCCNSRKNTLWVAFIAGLAPCSFAWSIFLLLIAIGESSWVLPLIIALGLGIATTLFIIVILSVYLKNKIYSKVSLLSNYSSIISASILLIVSLILLGKLFI